MKAGAKKKYNSKPKLLLIDDEFLKDNDDILVKMQKFNKVKSTSRLINLLLRNEAVSLGLI